MLISPDGRETLDLSLKALTDDLNSEFVVGIWNEEAYAKVMLRIIDLIMFFVLFYEP
jgi:hypothetical protein